MEARSLLARTVSYVKLGAAAIAAVFAMDCFEGYESAPSVTVHAQCCDVQDDVSEDDYRVFCEEEWDAGTDFEMARIGSFLDDELDRCHSDAAQSGTVEARQACEVLDKSLAYVSRLQKRLYDTVIADRRSDERGYVSLDRVVVWDDDCFRQAASNAVDRMTHLLIFEFDSACEEYGPRHYGEHCDDFRDRVSYIQGILQERAAFEYPDFSFHGQRTVVEHQEEYYETGEAVRDRVPARYVPGSIDLDLD